MFRYHIDVNSDTPIYRQLADQIHAQIRSGVLESGTQLPTVRQMAEKLQLSCGTVKHVYDYLQDLGDIQMTRRKGTFVKYVHKDTDSRKQQAMNAIDQMVIKLSELNFSPAEIQIFLNIKMREWGVRWSGIRMTVVTDYSEFAPFFAAQLEQIGNVQVETCSLRQLHEYPYSVDEHSDVILCSVEDAQQVSAALPDTDKLLHVAFAPDTESVAALSVLHGVYAGVCCEEKATAALIRRFLPSGCRATNILSRDEAVIPDGMDLLIIPKGWENACVGYGTGEPSAAQPQRKVIEFGYRLDTGSMLYLEERIRKMRDERQLWPGVLKF